MQLLLQQGLIVTADAFRAWTPYGLLAGSLEQLLPLMLHLQLLCVLLLPLLLQRVGVLLLVLAELLKCQAVGVWGLGWWAGAHTWQLPGGQA